MPKVPYDVVKESYLLKSTFFYNKLKSNGYFKLFMDIQHFSSIEGMNINWNNKEEWKISKSAWEIIDKNAIDPLLIFLHPKILQLNPSYLKYYRSVAMIPQKGLKALSGVSNVDAIENGKIEAGRLPAENINKLVCIINEIISLVITLASDIDENKIQGMMYATAGVNIDGSWRNSIGAEGERVVRGIILKEVLINKEVTSIVDRQNTLKSIDELTADAIVSNIDSIKTINLTNGYSIMFSSEPDVSMFDDQGKIVGIIEIKAGLDPAGALERLGAMLKSFENTLAEYPNAVTVLVASCITEEVEARLGASMAVRQKYITTEITSNEKNQRKFANRMRKILRLIK